MALEKDNKVAMSPEDLTTMIATAVRAAVEEAKKPYISEDDKKKLAQAQLDRVENAAMVKAEHDKYIFFRKQCVHTHRDGTPHTVFVHDELGGYILCQKCQAIVRPGNAPKEYSGDTFYDTQLYNKLFQLSSPTSAWE